MKILLRIYKQLMSDSLHRNSLYLFLSNLAMSFFGFFFWMINTRIFTTEQIGLSTAILSSISLITGFSLLGMNIGIIRFIPKALKKNEIINTVLFVVLLSSIISTGIYVLGMNSFAPNLLFIRNSFGLLAFFACIAVASSFESIYNNVFIAIRDTKYILINNIIKGILKLTLPAILVGLGAFAIFASASVGTVLTISISLLVLHKYHDYNYKITFVKDIFKKIYKISFGNYVAALIAGLPLTLLPIMINNTLGAKNAAYFYMVAMIISLLNTIQSSVSYSLFAEGSHDENNLRPLIIKSIYSIGVVLIPAIIITFFFGSNILDLFGKEYSTEGIALLRLMSVSVIFTTINGVLSTILNIKNKVNLILLMCIIGPSILMALIYLLLPHGLMSLGYAWLIGEGLIAIIYSIIVYLKVL